MASDIKLNGEQIVIEGTDLFLNRGAEKQSVGLNFQNPNGYWHISEPRSYESNTNPLSIYWWDNEKWSKPYLTITDDGTVKVKSLVVEDELHIGRALNFNTLNGAATPIKGSFDITGSVKISNGNLSATVGSLFSGGECIPPYKNNCPYIRIEKGTILAAGRRTPRAPGEALIDLEKAPYDLIQEFEKLRSKVEQQEKTIADLQNQLNQLKPKTP